MEFSEIEYTPVQKEFFAYLKSIGCVVHTVILNPHTVPVDMDTSAKEAALKGMEIVGERYAASFKKVNRGVDIQNYFQIKIDPLKVPKGMAIDYARFLGEYAQGEVPERDDENNGLVYALLDAPYGLTDQIGFADKRAFYGDLLQKYQAHFLGITAEKDTEALTFMAWSDDWSNYFDAGKEWWGTFCWTVYDRRNNTFVFIAASSSD